MYSNTAIFKPEPVAAAAPAGAFLLDDVRDANIAVSIRKLRSSYTGNCIQIRRSSDNATQDIGFDSNGDIDTAAISTFCGGGSGFVRIWYDQSGKGNNFQQLTNGSQPIIYDVGSMITNPAGNYSIRNSLTSNSTGTGTYFMDIAALLSGGDESYTPTITTVGSLIAHNGQGIWTTDLGNGYSQGTYSQTSGRIGSANKNGAVEYSISSIPFPNNVLMLTTFFNRDGGASTAYANSLNGTLSTSDVNFTYSAADANSVTYQNPTIFRYPVPSLFNNIMISEFIFWDIPTSTTTLSSTEKSDMRSNINTYYGLQ